MVGRFQPCSLFPTLSTLLSACSMVVLPWPPPWSLFVLSWVGQTTQGGCQDQRRCPAKLRSGVSPTTKAIERPRAQTDPSAGQTAPSTESGHASALALCYVVSMPPCYWIPVRLGHLRGCFQATGPLLLSPLFAGGSSRELRNVRGDAGKDSGREPELSRRRQRFRSPPPARFFPTATELLLFGTARRFVS